MKYSELISFKPIESTIQLVEGTKTQEAEFGLVKSYVMSDSMAENLKAPVIDQIQLDEFMDNKGVLVVGNYGTGKSHLMSLISTVAKNEEALQYIQNKKFAEDAKRIAGKFEILRLEIGGVTMSLREIIYGYIQDDFASRGIDFDVPDFSTVKDNKKLIRDTMIAFEQKYPDKGYLIVVDEFLSYLTSRTAQQIVLDMEFLRALGEMCSKSKLRVIFGVQEKIFDNPRFSFVSDTLKHVADRFTQIIITKEATEYVVSERILKKTAEQKAMIREHLEKFTNLYSGMSTRIDSFVDLYPIHPAYIDVFNKVYLIENRHILKNISLAIKEIFDTDVPEDAPGIISFDDYWPHIKNNGLLKSDPTISRVVTASGQLEEIIDKSFPKLAYKNLAIKIIYALSVHRLTTNSLDVEYGLTAENLKDDLCLHLQMPEQEPDFLLGIVNTTLRDIMTTVSGQFIFHNDANNQYYIDVEKTVDYDEKIRQKSSLLSDSDLNHYFYEVVYSCLEWDKKQYVTGFNIYEHDLNWTSHNIFREGYLFMGLPGERSTAQPERDFYIHIMPPYGNAAGVKPDARDDEVYFFFNSTGEFKGQLALYTAANNLAQISEGKDRESYQTKANMHRKKLVRFLNDNKNTVFDVEYKHVRHQTLEVLKGKYNPDATFGDTIDLAASICLDEYFNIVYPEHPALKVKITRKNMNEVTKAAIDHFAGRKTKQSAEMLDSFGILDGDKIKPEESKYASYYIDMIKKLPPQGVINFSDIFEPWGTTWQMDKRFRIWYNLTPIIFLSLVYGGYAEITLTNGEKLTTATLDTVAKKPAFDLAEFKYISKPTEIAMAELKRMCDVLDINSALMDNPSSREAGVTQLLEKAKALNTSAVFAEHKLSDGLILWGEPLVDAAHMTKLKNACAEIKNEFSNYSAKYNTPAKLNNFKLSIEDVDNMGEQIKLARRIDEYDTFRNVCQSLVKYVSEVELQENIGVELQEVIKSAKANFREIKDKIMDNMSGDAAAKLVTSELEKIREQYIELYMTEHKKRRLGLEDTKRKGKIQEGTVLNNLRKLRDIEMLSSSKLSAVETSLAGLKSCYELTATELRNNPTCPHCHFTLDDKTQNVFGQLENIETRLEELKDEWTSQLLDTMTSDPLVLSQKEFLSPEQGRVIEQFIDQKALPDKVDDFFISSINTLLQGFDPVVIEADKLMQKLESLPPCDVITFKAKVEDIVSEYVKGKDPEKLRIIVKHQESEE